MKNGEVVRRYRAGDTLQEIADEKGVSRQRIHQLVKRAGAITRTVKARRRNIKLARRGGQRRCSCGTFFRATEADPRQSCSPLCSHLRRRIGPGALAQAMVELSRKVQRTPTAADIIESGGYSVGAYTREFGSLVNAQRAAGLTPNGRGRAPSSLKR